MKMTPQTIPQIKAECKGKIMEAIQDRLDAGMDQKTIATELGVPPSTICRMIQKWPISITPTTERSDGSI